MQHRQHDVKRDSATEKALRERRDYEDLRHFPNESKDLQVHTQKRRRVGKQEILRQLFFNWPHEGPSLQLCKKPHAKTVSQNIQLATAVTARPTFENRRI